MLLPNYWMVAFATVTLCNLIAVNAQQTDSKEVCIILMFRLDVKLNICINLHYPFLECLQFFFFFFHFEAKSNQGHTFLEISFSVLTRDRINYRARILL